MTKHEADVIGGLNMTDQISNEAYKQIMIAAQDENEVGDVLDKIKAEIEVLKKQEIYKSEVSRDARISSTHLDRAVIYNDCLDIINKYMKA